MQVGNRATAIPVLYALAGLYVARSRSSKLDLSKEAEYSATRLHVAAAA
jgi:hypothetical protein